MATGTEVGRGPDAERVLESLGNAVIDAARAIRRRAAPRREPVGRAPGEDTLGSRAAHDGDRPRRKTLGDATEFLRHDIVSFVPGDAFPFSLAPLTDALQRMKETILVILILEAARAHQADTPIELRQRKGPRLDADDAVIFDMREDSASRSRVAIRIANGSNGPLVGHVKCHCVMEPYSKRARRFIPAQPCALR